MPKTNISEELYQYALTFGIKEHPILRQLREYNQTLSHGKMQIALEQGQFMAILTKIINAKKYLEIGVFTGYSSLSVALGMEKQGKLYLIESNEEYINIAQKFWNLANVDKQITLLIGDASLMLDKLCTNEHISSFDMAFIDANKSNYLNYYEYCYKLVRPGGIILIDNTLMQGKVLDENSPNFIKAVDEFNKFIYDDRRVEMVMLPIADGLTIAYKKEI
ncbi:MAG: O-methyltransferase [Neisseriaceae bacterium]